MSVFKRLPGSHMHVRTPIMIGVILLLVVVLSAFCFYRPPANPPTTPVPTAPGVPPSA